MTSGGFLGDDERNVGSIIVIRPIVDSADLCETDDFDNQRSIAKIYKNEPMLVLETCIDPIGMIVSSAKVPWIKVLSSHGVGFVKWAMTKKIDRPDFE